MGMKHIMFKGKYWIGKKQRERERERETERKVAIWSWGDLRKVIITIIIIRVKSLATRRYLSYGWHEKTIRATNYGISPTPCTQDAMPIYIFFLLLKTSCVSYADTKFTLIHYMTVKRDDLPTPLRCLVLSSTLATHGYATISHFAPNRLTASVVCCGGDVMQGLLSSQTT